VLLASALPIDARDLAKVFESKPVRVIVGSAPGGGYDTFSRMVARFSGKYLPGNPRFIVKNIPGGGQLRGLRAAMRAKPDGLTLGLLHPRFVQRELSGVDVPDFDLKTVRVLGSPSAIKVPRIWCARRSVATTWNEVKKVGRPLTNGDQAPGASNGMGPQFVSEMGGPIKMVYGYSGTSEIMAAFDRGETDSIDRCTREHVPRLFPRWVKEKIVAPIFWWEKEPSKDWLGKLGVNKIPHVLEIVGANKDQRNAFELAVSFNTFSRIFVTAPGVPDDMYYAWKKAFEATTRDPGFLRAAEAAGLEVGLGTADDFNKLVKSFERLSPAGVKLLKRLIGQ
jgi:tripartite-type tricarboxylate transporter receptor subunit TctC